MTRTAMRPLVFALALVIAIATAWGCYIQTWDGDYTFPSLLLLPAIVAAVGVVLMVVPRFPTDVGVAVVAGAVLGPILMFSANIAYLILV